MTIPKISIKKLLADSGKEYRKIANAAAALKNGKISGDNFNQLNSRALNNVDKLINEYAHK